MPKSPSSKRWLENHRKDPFVQRAKREGLRGRASYKLEEIQKQYRFINDHATIIDLGAAPGSWSQYLSEQFPHATLIGCDLLPISPIPNVTFIQGDFTDPLCQDQIKALSDTIDIIVCDMAPNATGQSKVDAWRAGALTEIVFDFCLSTLKKEGHLLIKLFHGSEFNAHLKWLRLHFKKVKIVKPPASRKQSREIYALAQDFNGSEV